MNQVPANGISSTGGSYFLSQNRKESFSLRPCVFSFFQKEKRKGAKARRRARSGAIDATDGICSNCFMLRGRILALDYGTRNVGLACCDEMGVTIRPLPSLPNRGRRDLVGRLRAAVHEHQVERILVGVPLNMDGTSGEAARRVDRFIAMLRADLGLPLESFDERLSTAEAMEIWRGMNPRQQKRYRSVDSLAAALILRRYLAES